MKNKLLATFILLLPIGIFAFFWFHPPRSPETVAPASVTNQDVALARALATASPQTTAAIASNFTAQPQTIFYSVPPKPAVAPAGAAMPLEFTNIPPAAVMDRMRHTIHDYCSMFGGNPVGENSEITSQLGGQNPKQANFIRPDEGMRIDDRGELVDPWGTPFFFHQLSGTHMEIRSAGPDKIMWTADDLVTE